MSSMALTNHRERAPRTHHVEHHVEHHTASSEAQEGRRDQSRDCTATKLRALAAVVFTLTLFFFAYLVFAAGWEATPEALFTVMALLSGFVYLRPGWVLDALQRWGGG